MSWQGVGKTILIDTIMNAAMYTDIFEKNLKSFTRKLRLRNTFIFQQDNDSKHAAKETQKWLTKIL